MLGGRHLFLVAVVVTDVVSGDFDAFTVKKTLHRLTKGHDARAVGLHRQNHEVVGCFDEVTSA